MEGLRVETELPISTGELAEALRCGRTRVSAIKRAMGIRGHKVFLSAVVKWLKQNPGFVEAEIYPRKGKARRQRDLMSLRRSSTRTR